MKQKSANIQAQLWRWLITPSLHSEFIEDQWVYPDFPGNDYPRLHVLTELNAKRVSFPNLDLPPDYPGLPTRVGSIIESERRFSEIERRKEAVTNGVFEQLMQSPSHSVEFSVSVPELRQRLWEYGSGTEQQEIMLYPYPKQLLIYSDDQRKLVMVPISNFKSSEKRIDPVIVNSRWFYEMIDAPCKEVIITFRNHIDRIEMLRFYFEHPIIHAVRHYALMCGMMSPMTTGDMAGRCADYLESILNIVESGR